ncbi:MAG: hypothetical protein ACFFG0_05890 [Candidatus Thorarchaeota archaeon]
MSIIEFLEEYPLYRKFNFDLNEDSHSPIVDTFLLNDFPEKNINMYCPKCNDIRTFRFTYKYIHKRREELFKKKVPPLLYKNDIVNLNYTCASCEVYHRFFAIKVGVDFKTIEKIGKFPPWSIKIEKNLKKLLGDYSENYRKGLICESQSYGIGAFAYYRRIVEDIIGELLELIPYLMTGEELEKYNEALKEVRNTKNAQEKIKLVKDLLPPILLPEQFNPLKTIYDVLSTGLHEKTDEECLDDAELIRTSLIFLVNTILSRKEEQQEYTESMRKILDKQRKKKEFKKLKDKGEVEKEEE